MEKRKVFRFLCKAVPHKYNIKPDVSSDKQPIFTQMSKEELEEMNPVGMPLCFGHINGIVVDKGKTNVKYNPNTIIGHVVEKLVTDEGSSLMKVEISPEKDTSSEAAKLRQMAKDAVIALVKNDFLKVSLTHTFDKQYEKDFDATIVRKFPLELSVVKVPERDGSNISTWFEADEPLLTPDKYMSFDAIGSGSTSAINHNPAGLETDQNNNNNIQDFPPKIQSDNSPPTTSPTDNTTTNNMSAPAPTPANPAEELKRLAQENEQLKKRLQVTDPVYEQVLKQKHIDTENQKKNLIKNAEGMFDFVQTIMQKAKDLKVPIEDDNKVVFDAVATNAATMKTAVADQMAKALMTEEREKLAAVNTEDVFKNFDQMMANLNQGIIACGVAFNAVNSVLEANAKSSVDATRNQAKGAGGSMTGAEQAPNEPQYQSFEALKNSMLAKRQAMK